MCKMLIIIIIIDLGRLEEEDLMKLYKHFMIDHAEDIAR